MKETRLELTDQFKIWQDPEDPNRVFIDLTLKFTRSLTAKETNQAIAHFATGLDRLGIADVYAIRTVDSSLPDILQLTFEILGQDVAYGLLQLRLEFKKMLPIQTPKSLVDLGLIDIEQSK